MPGFEINVHYRCKAFSLLFVLHNVLIWMSLLCFNQWLVPVNLVHDALVRYALWCRHVYSDDDNLPFTLVNMSPFCYFGCEKVKAGGDNNLEAMKKDDDQSNAMDVSKSTAELAEE